MANYPANYHSDTKGSRILAGIFLLVIGGALILREANTYMFPDWLFTWQVMLIVIGIFVGLKKQFQGPGWLILIAIGSFFILDEIIPEFNVQRYLVPLVVIGIGLMFIFKPGCRSRRWRHPATRHWRQEPFTTPPAPGTEDETLEESAVFGNIKKTVVSKNFRGGEISCVFGSGDLNFSQAEMQQPAELEVNAVFGSIRLIVPAHWKIKMETTAVLGGVQDKRAATTIHSDKLLVLKGTAVFGGIEINSYQ